MTNSKQDRKLFYNQLYSGKRIMEKTNGVPYQKCPLCDGSGESPWFMGEGQDNSCPTCKGDRIIPMYTPEQTTINSGQLTEEQVEAVVQWMETWEQLKGTAIPMRFKGDFAKHLKKENEIPPPYLTEEPPIFAPYVTPEFVDAMNKYVPKKESTPAPQTAPPYTFTHGQRFKAKYKGEEIEGIIKIVKTHQGNLLKFESELNYYSCPESTFHYEGLYVFTDLVLYPLEKQ